MTEPKPKRRADVRAAKLAGKTFLARHQKAFELNDVAADFWKLADGTKSIAQIAVELGKSYEVDVNTLEADCTELSAELFRLEVLTFV